ncbi:hypothetical protein [Streptomyces sp. NBC_00343]|uniref:hypothetical protein n=1 Tax=Streptomyces sp. NBC_00343 TaxID=2975719 RepID=UPI002E2E59ED|nr:hypothetical protein [Streptomyces sp. NBC_00343]
MSNNDQPATPLDRFRTDLLDAFATFERDRRADLIAAGDDRVSEDDPLDYVRALTTNYETSREDPGALRMFLDTLARQLSLDEARALRVAGEAAVAATPRLIREANGHGMKAADIADELGVTESYVYRKLRERQKEEAALSDEVTGEAPPVDEYRLSTHTEDQ